MEDSEESFDTGFVDLFEHSSDDESPIARLKTIVLSIDWEINDQVLTQFNDELLALKDTWSDDQVRLVYVQALEKISKYIYQQKSEAHPNAIKLLLTFYYDLEKIVLDDDLDEEEVKEMLREDVRKFEQLKQQIGTSVQPQEGGDESPASSLPGKSISEMGDPSPVLFDLKAYILGMDWEITDKELGDLGKEVSRLETEFAGNKPRLLFLQGIGALGGYIKLKKSNAHSDAFKLLYSFYEGLEKIVETDLSRAEEKEILLTEVEKFEQFKQTIASTITPEGLTADATTDDGSTAGAGEDVVAPAFADVPDEVQGFQAEQEAAELEGGDSLDVESKLENFFSDEEAVQEDSPASALVEESAPLPKEALEKIDSFFGEEGESNAAAFSVSAEEALRGVDVETEADDDSDEEALPTQDDGIPLPALSESEEEDAQGFNPDVDDQAPPEAEESQIADSVGDLFEEEEPDTTSAAETALAGVDVETDADDDSDEPPLPQMDDEIAPALSFEEEEEEISSDDEPLPGDIEDRLDAFFDGDEEEVLAPEIGDEDNSEPVLDEVDSFFDEEEPDTLMAESEPSETEQVAESAEVESEIESFFGDDGNESDDDLFRQADEEVVLEPESAEDEPLGLDADSEEVSEPLDEEPAFTLSNEEPAEEVVFEAIAEDDELPGEDIPVAIIEEDDQDPESLVSSFGTGSDEEEFFASIDERVDEPGEFQMEILDESDDLEDGILAEAAEPIADTAEELDNEVDESEEEIGDPETAALIDEDEDDEEEFSFTSDDPLADLRAGIASLGIEINDQIIEGIYSEVNSLRHRLMTRPVEKTFLQLLSTIVQHIGQYRYEASAEAHGLLLSVFDKLELVQNAGTEHEQAQETLLAETCKVLLWQQKMLDRQAVKKGDQLTFIAPVRSESSEEAEAASVEDVEEFLRSEEPGTDDFSAVFEPVDDDESPVEAGSLEESDFNAVFEEVAEETEELTTELDEEIVQPLEASEEIDELVDTEISGDEIDLLKEVEREPIPVEEGDEAPLATLVKKEIEALRESLRDEIRELKEQLKGRD
ncbi:MAG: hypothetical protein D6B25_00565 [Desulfobulbaceae bacterium]|nr:MAG: hypothetical protein D6B25_00565 [Desulfobulbaceae bacterium]